MYEICFHRNTNALEIFRMSRNPEIHWITLGIKKKSFKLKKNGENWEQSRIPRIFSFQHVSSKWEQKLSFISRKIFQHYRCQCHSHPSTSFPLIFCDSLKSYPSQPSLPLSADFPFHSAATLQRKLCWCWPSAPEAPRPGKASGQFKRIKVLHSHPQ